MGNCEQGKWVDICAPNVNDFKVSHGLGRAPVDAHLEVTCRAFVAWQPKMFDEENLYLWASRPGATGRVWVR